MMKKNLTLLLSLGALFMISAKCGGKGSELEPQSVITEEEKKEVSEALAVTRKPEYKNDVAKLNKFDALRAMLSGPGLTREKAQKNYAELIKLQPEVEKAQQALGKHADYVQAMEKISAFGKNFEARLKKMQQALFKPSMDDYEKLFGKGGVSAGDAEEETDEE